MSSRSLALGRRAPDRLVLTGLTLVAVLTVGSVAVAQFPPTIDVVDLDGDDGFRATGLQSIIGSGAAMADLNGDGVSDLLLGSDLTDLGGNDAGGAWIVFGQFDFSAQVNVTNLPAGQGVEIRGAAEGEKVGDVVAAGGDLNGDGIGDLALGADRAGGSGKVYVVFGRRDYPEMIDLALLDGTDGFVIHGVEDFDNAGSSVAFAGDVNGDGAEDLAIGAPFAAGADDSSGVAYVVYGAAAFAPELELVSLDGTNGFSITGFRAAESLGGRVRPAGDVNGDGVDDLLVGASWNGINGYVSGAAYLVFGDDAFGAHFDLAGLDGTNGFGMLGLESGDSTGWSLAAVGDIDADGRDDIAVGAPGADGGGASGSGVAYVVFGDAAFPRNVDLTTLDGGNGFVAAGAGSGESSSWNLAAGGDVNGDGIADLVIGASPDDYSGSDAGGWALFGRPTFPAVVSLAGLDGSDGFAVEALSVGDGTGRGVAVTGDLNRDGLDDAVFRNGVNAYVVYGRSASGISLGLTGLCPGALALRSEQLTPGGSAALFRSQSRGSDVLDAGPCVGTALDLEAAELAGVLVADAAGRVLLEGVLGVETCAGFFQIVDGESCLVSNVSSAD